MQTDLGYRAFNIGQTQIVSLQSSPHNMPQAEQQNAPQTRDTPATVPEEFLVGCSTSFSVAMVSTKLNSSLLLARNRSQQSSSTAVELGLIVFPRFLLRYSNA